MAPRITGSANREKRKAQSSNRPVTQGQNPQRSNRQGVSRATVSNGGTTGNNSATVSMGRGGRTPRGSAPVTGAPAPKALPYAKPGTGGPRLLSASQNVQPQARPAQPGTSRPPTPTRAQAATARAAQAANGGTSSGVRVGQPGKNPGMASRQLSKLVSNRGVGANAIVSGLLQLPSEIDRMRSGYYDLSKPNAERQANLTAALGSDPSKAAWNPLKANPKPAQKPKATDDFGGQYQRLPAGTKPVPVKAKSSSTASRSNSSSGSGSRSSSGTSRPSVRAATAAKKAEPGQSKDMNENYRTWAAKYGKLADKVKKGQAGYSAFGKDAVASSPDTTSTASSGLNSGQGQRMSLNATAQTVAGGNKPEPKTLAQKIRDKKNKSS